MPQGKYQYQPREVNMIEFNTFKTKKTNQNLQDGNFKFLADLSMDLLNELIDKIKQKAA